MRTLIISLILSLIAVAAVAQTNYYPNTTGTITKSGYTYKYRNYKIGDAVMPDLELYNATNPYLDKEWRHKDGTPLSAREQLGEGPNSELFDSNLTITQTFAIVNGLFSSQQKTSLKGKLMFIKLKIDSSTGKIADVYFIFQRNDSFANIPVETFRSIELALKEKLTFTVTAQGRKMNYLQLFWSQKF